MNRLNDQLPLFFWKFSHDIHYNNDTSHISMIKRCASNELHNHSECFT